MIYRITYLSDGYKVKGYLSLPYQYEITAEELQLKIEAHYARCDLPVTAIACAWQPQPPVSVKKELWPAFIYCRGGIGRIGSVKTHWLEQFTEHQHVVFAPTYRGNEGGEGRDEFGGADQEDVRSACELLKSLPFIDTNRISIMGFSRGAINAAQAAVDMPELSKLVLWSGVSNLAQTYEERVDLRRMLKRVLNGNPNKHPEAYIARSPIHFAEHIQCPVLVIHGTSDHQVNYTHGEQIYSKLQELGIDSELHAYEGYDHHFPPDVHKQAVERMFTWINEETPQHLHE